MCVCESILEKRPTRLLPTSDASHNFGSSQTSNQLATNGCSHDSLLGFNKFARITHRTPTHLLIYYKGYYKGYK